MGNLKLEICKIETLALCKFCSTEEVCWLIVNILLHKHLHHVTLPMRKRMMQCRLQWVQCCSSGEGRACSVITINWLATIISGQLLQHSLRHSLPTLMLTPRCLDTRQGKGHSHYWSSLGFSLDTLNWRRKNLKFNNWQLAATRLCRLTFTVRDISFSNFNTVTVIVLRWKHHFLPRWHWTYESHLASVSLCTFL